MDLMDLAVRWPFKMKTTPAALAIIIHNLRGHYAEP